MQIGSALRKARNIMMFLRWHVSPQSNLFDFSSNRFHFVHFSQLDVNDFVVPVRMRKMKKMKSFWDESILMSWSGQWVPLKRKAFSSFFSSSWKLMMSASQEENIFFIFLILKRTTRSQKEIIFFIFLILKLTTRSQKESTSFIFLIFKLTMFSSQKESMFFIFYIFLKVDNEFISKRKHFLHFSHLGVDNEFKKEIIFFIFYILKLSLKRKTFSSFISSWRWEWVQLKRKSFSSFFSSWYLAFAGKFNSPEHSFCTNCQQKSYI